MYGNNESRGGGNPGSQKEGTWGTLVPHHQLNISEDWMGHSMVQFILLFRLYGCSWYARRREIDQQSKHFYAMVMIWDNMELFRSTIE